MSKRRAATIDRNAAHAGDPGPLLSALAGAFQHVAIGMAIGDPAGRLVAVNPALCRMLGCERDALMAQEFAAIVAPDGHGGVSPSTARPCSTGPEAEALKWERTYERQDGSHLWGLVTVSPLRDDAGQCIGALAQVQDITAQKAATAAMRENEARLTALVEQMPVALYSLSPNADGSFHYVSPLFERLTGLGRDDLPTTIGDLLASVHPDDRASVLAADIEAGRSGEPAQLQYRIRGGAGEWIWIDNRVVLTRDEHGQPLAWHGALLDISAQVRLQASLQASETRFRRAFDDAAIGMSLGNVDHVCIDVNAAYCRMVGRTRDELVGRSFVGLTHPEDVDAYLRQVERLHAGEIDNYEIEKRYVRPDGTVVIGRLTVSAVRDDAGNFLYDIGQLQDITEHKAAAAAQRANEARLRKLVEHLPAALYRQEAPADGSATYVNPRFATLLGLDPGELPLGLPAFFDRVHPDDRDAVGRSAAEAERTGEAMDVVYRVQRGDGEWTWVHDRSVLEPDAAGQPRTWTGILLDISERKRLEASLRASEAHVRTIVEQVPAAVFRLEPGTDGRFTYTSPRFSALTGLSLDRRNGGLEAYFARVHPDDIAAVRAADEASARTGQPFDLEYRLRGHDGSWVWVHDCSVLTEDEFGNPLAWHGVLLDVSERRRLEASLRESEERFRALVQNDPDVMVIVDDAMRVAYMSPSSLTAFGVPPEDLLGPIEPNLSNIHAADLDGALALFGEVDGRPGAVASVEARIKHRDLGWRWFQITVANRIDEPGIDGYLFNLRDITDRKHAALALETAIETQRAAIAELKRLNQSKSRFLSTISHEFRTPLTAIIGYSEFLAQNAGDPAAIADDAAVIHREASRLNRLVDDVLLIDRAEAGHLPLHAAPVDLNEIVQDVVAAFRPIAERHHLALSLDPALRRVDGDRDRLAQAVTNLLSNAVKYAPGGGTITIGTGNIEREVLLSVHDEGIGIDASDLTRIFDRFERVETGIAGRIGGTGLGLSIAHEIASLHGGRLWAESEPGLGSTFHLALPAGVTG